MKLTHRLSVLPFLLLACLLSAPPASAADSQPASKPARPAAKKAGKKPHKKPAKKAAAKTDYVGEAVNFGEWKAVSEFAAMMVAKHGFERSAIDATIAQVRFVDAAVQLVKPAPPGKPKNWQAYRALFIEPVRIKAGVSFWNDNAELIAKAEATYGVPAEIIVGILGVETVYGRNTGRFRVLDALTTLAFAYPETPNRLARMAFFRDELEQALLLARKEKIDPFTLLGSFAGAVGMPQFMPSSVLQFGVDADGDGIIDLRNSPADIVHSVAHYLATHGWDSRATGPLAYPANVSPNKAWEGLIGKDLVANLSAEQLQAAGVVANQPLPTGMQFGLVDLQNGAEATEFWLGNANFFAITQYNRSFFYAMSVIELGRAVKLARETQ